MAAVENLLIDGQRVPSAEGRTFDTVNPATGAVFRTVAEAGAEDADRAVHAAARALDDWAARTPIQRAKVLYRWADLIEEHADELALTETRDMGMAIGDARWIGVRVPQSSNARAAARTARSASSAPASATVRNTSPFAGLTVSNVRPSAEGTRSFGSPTGRGMRCSARCERASVAPHPSSS